jgi:hypothetical protein
MERMTDSKGGHMSVCDTKGCGKVFETVEQAQAHKRNFDGHKITQIDKTQKDFERLEQAEGI